MIKPRLYADDNAETARFALHVLSETLALSHPVIPFVTEEIWDHLPGPKDLLMGHRWPEADPALRDLDVEAEVQRAIEATKALRAWRDDVGAAPGKAVPARLEAEGYERVADHVARIARFEFATNGDEPVATVGVPGRQRRGAGVRRRRPRGREAPRGRAEGDAAQGDRARRGQARATRASSPRRPSTSSRPSGTSWSSCGGSWTSSHEHVGSGPGRGASALARAVRDALRPGAHAAAADRARLAAGAVPGRARGRDQRQVVDGALHGGAAGGARRPHRRVPVAAPDDVRGADPGR